MAAAVYAMRLADMERLDGLALLTHNEAHYREDLVEAMSDIELEPFDDSNVVDLAGWVTAANSALESI